MIELSKRVEKLLANVFSDQAQREEAKNFLIEECADNVPFMEKADPESMDRIRFAVLKLSEGDLDKLIKAVELANIDWRDLFVSAGFGHDVQAHNHWYETQCQK